VLGGKDELRGVFLSAAISPSSWAIFASKMRMMACASGGCRAITSSAINGSGDMPMMSQISSAARRPFSNPDRYRGVNGYHRPAVFSSSHNVPMIEDGERYRVLLSA
jgi:hypothetical protein